LGGLLGQIEDGQPDVAERNLRARRFKDAATVGPAMRLRSVHLIDQAWDKTAHKACNATHRAPQSFGRAQSGWLVSNRQN
jgi:hypothetical protein